MSDLRITELTGESDDPECFHCALPPFIQKWVREHPGKCHTHMMLDIAQTLGELIGSNAPTENDGEAILNRAYEVMLETYAEIRALRALRPR